MLLHIPALLSPDACKRLTEKLDNATWTDGRETVGAAGAQVKRNQQLPEVSALRAELAEEVLAALSNNALFFSAALPLRISTPRFNRYADQGEYGFHVDGAVMRAGPATHIRSDVSCTVFLSEPEAYEGGELVISDTYGEHAVKLAAGDMIVYPASSLHRVEPVTHGARLAAFFWVQSMVRDDSRRRMLFEMDGAIETLRTSGADGTATLQLTGVYHNLLRQWAET